MALSEQEEFELLSLERERSNAMPLGRATAIREEYPSERFSKFTELPSRLAGMFAKSPIIGPAIAAGASGLQEAGRQAVSYASNEPNQPESLLTRGRMVGEAALEGAVGEGIGRGVGMGASRAFEAAKPSLIKTGSQLMKVTAGIPEESGKAVLSRPSRLGAAPSKEEAGKFFGEVIDSSKNVYGAKATKATTGNLILGEKEKINLLNETINDIQNIAGKESSAENALIMPEIIQKALTARYQLTKMLKAAKWNDPKLAAEKAELNEATSILDDWLEPRVPGYREARGKYFESKLAEEFSSLLPTNANKSASVLRGLIAAGAASAGAYGGGPSDIASGLGVAALMSPRMLGYGIRAGSAVAPAVGLGARTGIRLGAQKAYEEMAPDAVMLRRKYMNQK